MELFCGRGVGGGIAIGRVQLFGKKHIQVRREGIENTENELWRLKRAKTRAMETLSEIFRRAQTQVGEANAEIFSIHMMMLEDDDYNCSIENIINTQKVNAEYAVAVTGENFAKMFSSMDDAYMRAREADVRDISNRLISCLSDSMEEDEKITENAVVCAHDLTPSETVLLDKDSVIAFVTEKGSVNSHTAILARSMNIPAIIGVGDGFMESLCDGDFIIVDGDAGKIFVNPDENTLRNARKRQKEDIRKKELLKELRGKENETLDGRRINIYANIGSADSVGEVLYNDAGGIGLFRSEFIYLENGDFPSEQYQFEIYKTVLESMAGKKVVIRTLDIGADKQADYFGIAPEENPALGLRGVRVCLTRPDVFRTQLRALYRASAYGCLAIMFPMISNKWEVEKILEICSEVRKELDGCEIPYNENTELGIMIETPAAAIISDELAPMVDFFSIGTNDLTQYTLACDRQNPGLESFCDTHHTALLRLISFACENAHKNGAWIGICGELAGDMSLTETFLKMGIDELSVSPSSVLKLREKVRSLKLD